MDEIEDMYKNYNILHLCNLYVDGMQGDDEMKQKVKSKLKSLHDLCVYNYETE